jgi:hypothetical protein
MQYGFSPYGPPSQIPRPSMPVDPSTPRPDGSQVNLYLFKLRFQNPNYECVFAMLHGSQSVQQPVVPYGGSPVVAHSPMWPPPPPAGFWPSSLPPSAGFWPPSLPPGQSSLTHPPHQVQGQWMPLMPWGHQPGG